ncbi:MAG TPA: 8-amino-7-oxononanoate synthase [Solirubrobacteraceae bacterium]
MSDLEARLREIERRGLRRRMRLIEGPQGPQVLLDGNPVTLLCSNNYLGLAGHPQVREAAAEAALRWGAGAGASRLVSGTMTVHQELERSLAEFELTQGCVLFGSGYLANLGVIGALAGPGDVVFSDALNHASIIDGCRLSRARTVVYRHLDLEHLEWCIARELGRGARTVGQGANAAAGATGRSEGHGPRALIVTDSVFSMDGDVAPLQEIVELAHRYRAQVMVDEAHATGALGPGGRGAVAAAGLQDEVDAVVGTLGKALGSYGAYVCASDLTVRYLVNVSRPLIFSTAPPPPSIAAAAAALGLLREQPQLAQRLRDAARMLRGALIAEGFAVADSEMHIVPLVARQERAAVELCEAALERGVFAQAIRPPTVPPGTSRLRLTVMATHRDEELHGAARALREAAEATGLDPASVGEPSAVAPVL